MTVAPEPPVLVERRDNVWLITLNRPHAMNAIDGPTADLLLKAFEDFDADSDALVGVLAANGRGFSAGMDLKAYLADGIPPAFEALLARRTDKPLIAAIEGFALAGGLEIALTADLLVAAEGAKLGLPEVSVGLFASGLGLHRLPKRLPYSLAMEIALTAQPITAEQAFQHGLVNRLCAPGDALRTAVELAERIARQAPLAVRASKQLVRDSLTSSEGEFWTIQEPWLAAIGRSSDGREGPLAFAEKRPPQWTGQ